MDTGIRRTALSGSDTSPSLYTTTSHHHKTEGLLTLEEFDREIRRTLWQKYPILKDHLSVVSEHFIRDSYVSIICEEHSEDISSALRVHLPLYDEDMLHGSKEYSEDVRYGNLAMIYVAMHDHGHKVMSDEILSELWNNAYIDKNEHVVIHNCSGNDFSQRDIRLLKYRRHLRRLFSAYFFAYDTRCSAFLYFIDKILLHMIARLSLKIQSTRDIEHIKDIDGQTLSANKLELHYFLPSFYKCVKNASVTHYIMNTGKYLRKLIRELRSNNILVTARTLDLFYGTNLNPYFHRISDIDIMKELKLGMKIYTELYNDITMKYLFHSPSDTFVYSVRHSRLVLYLSFLGIDFYNFSGAKTWAQSNYGAEVNIGSSLPLFLDTLRMHNFKIENLRLGDMEINIIKEKQAMIKRTKPITIIKEAADAVDIDDTTRAITEETQERLSTLSLIRTQTSITNIFRDFKSVIPSEVIFSEATLKNYAQLNKDEIDEEKELDETFNANVPADVLGISDNGKDEMKEYIKIGKTEEFNISESKNSNKQSQKHSPIDVSKTRNALKGLFSDVRGMSD